MLSLGGLAAGSALALGATGAQQVLAQGQGQAQPAPPHHAQPFVYCLNTGTIRGQRLSLEEEIDVAAKAGYTAIEPWMEKIHAFADEGGSLEDLGKKIADQGLTVESAIGFAQWIVDDDEARARGLEQAKRDMDRLSRMGCKRLAAPPSGATNRPGLNLLDAARRYRALLEAGDEVNVVPQVEVWGFSQNLNRLGDSMYVVLESGHPKACLLPDVYHIFKGGSDFAGLSMLSAEAIPVFHMNDYPATPGREELGDGHRVYPGDGVAPMTWILRDRLSKGGQTVLSLELFSRELWELDPLKVAADGLAKMRAAVDRALAGPDEG